METYKEKVAQVQFEDKKNGWNWLAFDACSDIKYFMAEFLATGN